jgi:hypothetical protein
LWSHCRDATMMARFDIVCDLCHFSGDARG